jgi:tripartite-type tricarboxylate transporter receptor subunit TctC
MRLTFLRPQAWQIAVIALSMTGTICARAGDFPERPIKFIVAFGAGGPTDIIARLLANQLSERLRQNVVVENKPGATGNIATQAVATAAPDGYTFLIGASPVAVNQTLFPDFPVKLGRDLVAIAPLGTTDNVLVVNPLLGVCRVSRYAALYLIRFIQSSMIA